MEGWVSIIVCVCGCAAEEQRVWHIGIPSIETSRNNCQGTVSKLHRAQQATHAGCATASCFSRVLQQRGICACTTTLEEMMTASVGDDDASVVAQHIMYQQLQMQAVHTQRERGESESPCPP